MSRMHRIHRAIHPTGIPRELGRALRDRTNGPIDEALAYKWRVGNEMEWLSAAGTDFGAEMDAALGAAFAVNVFLRDGAVSTAPGTPTAGAPSS